MDETPALDIKFESLIATVVEATVIVVESKLHKDPVPSLRGHRARILEERETLYQSYAELGRPVIDQLLYSHGFDALHRIYRLDSVSIQDSVRRVFAELLFYEPSVTSVCAGSAGLTAPGRAPESRFRQA